MTQLNRAELERILDEVKTTSYSDVQSIEHLLSYGFRLMQYMSFSASQMVEAKEVLHTKRRQAYINLAASMKSQEVKMGPMLMKDYINDVCSKENSEYELAERVNKLCVHGIDLSRTATSALKIEMSTMNYSQSA